jgi:hypothetical protein
MQQHPVSTATTDAGKLQRLVHRLLTEAQESGTNQRAEEREPFFRPVTITMDGRQRQFSCFSRDISTQGIGLLHYMELPHGKVMVTIPSESGEKVRIEGDVVWSKPSGEGWYISGVRFLKALV